MKTLTWKPIEGSTKYPMNTGMCIWDWIDTSPDYENGVIEALNSKVVRIMDVLQNFANILTEEQQRDLMGRLYDYEEVKEQK